MINYEVLNPFSEEFNTKANGSSFQGEVEATFAEMEELFGKPGEGDGYKVTREWAVIFDAISGDKVLATIYDWKSTALYEPDCWSPAEQYANMYPYSFHIGGFDPQAVFCVKAALHYLRKEKGLLNYQTEERHNATA